ncbi:hypothetical protein [Asanoa ishikariensis]|uniref:hypothetical protein n=1 Tax=Asanoa ishikariensis TaxID=137265 RepID=UPI00115FBD31|nr:hypothetical protein [Asanoa ishikariensis]
MVVAILSHDPEASMAAVFFVGFGICYGYIATVGSYVQVRDGALIVANLFRAHRIPLRRFVDFTSMEFLVVRANTVDQKAIEIQAMVQLQSTSFGGIKRKLKRLRTMLDEHGAPPADGPVTVRLRWESLAVMGVGLAACVGGSLIVFLVY